MNPGSLVRIQKPRWKGSLLSKSPRIRGVFPETLPHPHPHPQLWLMLLWVGLGPLGADWYRGVRRIRAHVSCPLQVGAPERRPGQRLALTVLPERRGAGGRPQLQRQGLGDRSAKIHRARRAPRCSLCCPRSGRRIELGRATPLGGARTPAQPCLGGCCQHRTPVTPVSRLCGFLRDPRS